MDGGSRAVVALDLELPVQRLHAVVEAAQPRAGRVRAPRPPSLTST